MSNRKREQQMVQKGFQFQESLKQVSRYSMIGVCICIVYLFKEPTLKKQYKILHDRHK